MTLEPQPASSLVDQERNGLHDGLGNQNQRRNHDPSASAFALETSETSETAHASSSGPLGPLAPVPSRPPTTGTTPVPLLPLQFTRLARALTLPQEQPLPVSGQGHSSLPPRSPPLSRSARSQSLAASLANQSPIRRKPLSPSASPSAIRFSTKDYLNLLSGAHDLQEGEPRHSPTFSDSQNCQSPALYDLSPITEGAGFATSLALQVQFEEE